MLESSTPTASSFPCCPLALPVCLQLPGVFGSAPAPTHLPWQLGCYGHQGFPLQAEPQNHHWGPRTHSSRVFLSWPCQCDRCSVSMEPPDTPAVTCHFSVALLCPNPFHQFPAFGMPSIWAMIVGTCPHRPMCCWAFKLSLA